LDDASIGDPTLPNSFAYIALFSWPAVCVLLFVMLPIEAAAIWSLLGGYLLLPSGASFDAPLLPPLDKFSIPAMTTFVLCWIKGTQAPAPRRSVLIYVLAFAFVVSPVFTTLNNSYELHIGDRSIPGFYPVDGMKMSLHNIISLAPFFLGMRFLSSDEARVSLLKSLPTAALFYSLPMLLEVWLSPQLHRWVYGYSPAAFVQQVRAGGYRPVVFLGGGLEVALFVSVAVIAAIVAVRAKWRIWRPSGGAVATYLGLLLVLCKSMGAMIYAVIAGPLVLLTGPRAWVRVALVLLAIVCAYPALRTFNLIPVHHIAEAASAISVDRSSSFKFRVENEDTLLAKANQKMLLGWGTWGRNRIYLEGSGQDLSTTDGTWIIQFGMFGWVGYLSLFGLFLFSVLRARIAVRGPVTQSSLAVGGMSILLAVNVIDMLPNASLTVLTYLMAGSIAGCVRAQYPRRSARPRVDGAVPAMAAQ
jgi:hypothetical protein